MDAEQRLEKAYQIMARIVCDHGDVALPIFQRLHEEREKIQSNKSLKNIALNVLMANK